MAQMRCFPFKIALKKRSVFSPGQPVAQKHCFPIIYIFFWGPNFDLNETFRRKNYLNKKINEHSQKCYKLFQFMALIKESYKSLRMTCSKEGKKLLLWTCKVSGSYGYFPIYQTPYVSGGNKI